MLGSKLFTVIVVIYGLMSELSSVTGRFPYTPKFLKCPKSNNIVYITDNENCFVFRNKCYMRNFFLKQLRAEKPKLFSTTKAVCQRLCYHDCGTEVEPVCGSLNGISNHTIFANDCELMKTACIIGEPIIRVHNNNCPCIMYF